MLPHAEATSSPVYWERSAHPECMTRGRGMKLQVAKTCKFSLGWQGIGMCASLNSAMILWLYFPGRDPGILNRAFQAVATSQLKLALGLKLVNIPRVPSACLIQMNDK